MIKEFKKMVGKGKTLKPKNQYYRQFHCKNHGSI